MVQCCWIDHERLYCLWVKHREFYREQEGGRIEHDRGGYVFAPPITYLRVLRGTDPKTHVLIANIKQVLTILFAVFMFELNITTTNAAGILFTLAGGAWYGYVGYEEKRRTSSNA